MSQHLKREPHTYNTANVFIHLSHTAMNVCEYLHQHIPLVFIPSGSVDDVQVLGAGSPVVAKPVSSELESRGKGIIHV